MVNTEQRIQKTFIKMLDKKNVDEIDVNSLCEQLKIKRQTFYYHFKNIYDLVYSIYASKDMIIPVEFNLNTIIENVYTFLYQDQDFNIMVIKSNASEALKDFLSSYVFKCLLKFLDKYNLRIDDKREIARFYSKAICEKCVYDFGELNYSIQEGVLKISFLFNNDVLIATIRKYQNNI